MKTRFKLPFLILATVLILSLVTSCATRDPLRSKSGCLRACKLGDHRYGELNSSKYMIQARRGTEWDETKRAWHYWVKFMSISGEYNAWVDPESFTIIEESLIGMGGKRGATLDDIVPPNYPRWTH